MTANLTNDQKFWDSHARHDPLWAILSDPTKKGRRWDLRSFFETGSREVSLLMFQLAALDIRLSWSAAIDFGCGIGRLSQPLSSYFDQVVGVDISPEMILLANQVNQEPDRVRYICNAREDLGLFAASTFSFAYSNVVLQHIAPALALEYLGELLRVLVPEGVLVFQLPSHARPAGEQCGASTAMADEAYSARIRVETSMDSHYPTGTHIILAAWVTNASPRVWDHRATGPIRLGNHWLTRAGDRMLIQDDGRATLPASLAPGESCAVSLPVRVPQDAGEYQLECDLVHEGISWFGDRGSETWRERVDASGAPKLEGSGARRHRPLITPSRLVLPEDAATDDPDVLPMHGIHADIVKESLREHGGQLIHQEIDERCGQEWIGYRYFVRKLG